MLTENIKIADLSLDPANVRKHDRKNLDAIKASLRKFGQQKPIVVDAKGIVIAGNGTMTAAQELGWTEIAAVRTALAGVEATAFAIADNRSAELAEWSGDLAGVLKSLADANVDLAELGFAQDDLEKISKDFAGNTAVDAEAQIDKADELRVKWGVETGQVWQLGEHRILCGDSTKKEDVEILMHGEKAVLCWTDPPWNVAYGESNNPAYKKRSIINDNLGEGFKDFATEFCKRIKENLISGGMLYMAMSAQEWGLIMQVLSDCEFHWSSTIIWNKSHPVMSRKDYHTKYEPIWYGWSDGSPRTHPLLDRKQSDVWDIPRPTRSDEHPTMKPIELVTRSLMNSSDSGSIIYEPFSGSGTTVLACEQTKRKCRAIEISPAYVAVAIQRWADATGKTPVKL